jgi:membrane protein implicated in regulation of membrane protease activity
MLLIGSGDSEASTDVDFDDIDPSLQLFTIRGVVAFFCIAGWSGLLFCSIEAIPIWASIILSIILGVAAFFAVAFMFKFMNKMQQDGTISPNDAIGNIGDVYLPIGANGTKTGKVTVLVSGRLMEMEAITESTRELKSGEKVKVTGVLSGNVLIVSPVV